MMIRHVLLGAALAALAAPAPAATGPTDPEIAQEMAMDKMKFGKRSGAIPFLCRYHPGMRGTLQVGR